MKKIVGGNERMWVFIVNPLAGNGRGRKVFEEIQKSDIYQSLKAVYFYSEYEGHEGVIAKEIKAKSNVKGIIIVGGDGTVHEVVNGLIPTKIPIGFIPAGSGNDFARGIGLKGSPVEILKRLTASNQTSPYWIGRYELDGKKTRYFMNSMGFGFDAETAHTANRSFYKKYFNQIRFGTGSYVVAVMQVLAQFKRRKIEVIVNGEKKVFDKALLLSVGNHPYYGGGMKMMPNAKNQSKNFAVLLVHSVPKWKVFALFLTVFIGKHEKINGVELFNASHLTMNFEKEIYTQVDGQTTTCKNTTISKHHDYISIIKIGKNT
jgi:YegS/Rv2252/BmrU family lipid kinase